MCVSFQDFRNIGKSTEPKCKLKYEKLLSGLKVLPALSSESKIGFINPKSKTWWSSLGMSRSFA